ncbi:hypothetical protein EVA_18338, partial [gut metagenome]
DKENSAYCCNFGGKFTLEYLCEFF